METLLVYWLEAPATTALFRRKLPRSERAKEPETGCLAIGLIHCRKPY